MHSIAIVGGGILGTSTAYWLSSLYDIEISILEKESTVAYHTSHRNTGVLHQPFYLNPRKKKIFARAARISYEECWKKYALEKGLPWKQVGTLEVATRDEDVETLEAYNRWAVENGMDENEVELLSSDQVRGLEPNVDIKCNGAIHCKTDTAVNYGKFTRAIKEDAESHGVKFIPNSEVGHIKSDDTGIKVHIKGRSEPFQYDFLINCAGGNSVDIAHMMGVGIEYNDLHFRGEYWVVDKKINLPSLNVYSVPKHHKYPFLDPHFIIRADGRCEVGPNAVLVAGPMAYNGIARNPIELLRKFIERPISNKLHLFTDTEFLSLVREEWRSSLSKNEMASRVRRFLPNMKTEYLTSRGIAGIRSSVLSKRGFEPEALELETHNSYHILNYNSPGATGGPAFSAYLINRLITKGYLKKPKPNSKATLLGDFQKIIDKFYITN